MKHILKKMKSVYTLVAVLCIAALGVEAFYVGVHAINREQMIPKPYYEPGYQFSDFAKYLRGVKEIGYLTNLDVSPEKNEGNFLMTQYMLAPVIVRLNNTRLEYLIVDSPSVPYLVMTMRALGLKRLDNNDYGQALMRKMR